MFQLETITPIRLVDVVVLSQKNREPDEDPGAKLSVSVDVANDALSMFDGYMLSALYTKNGKATTEQIPLEGVPPVSDKPDLTNIGKHVPRIAWAEEILGYRFEIDVGDGTRSKLRIDNCTASNWRLHPKNGGTVTVKFDVESNDVTEQAFGKLAKCKSREVRARLTWHEPPAPKQKDIDDTRNVDDTRDAQPAKPKRTLKGKMASAAKKVAKTAAKKANKP